MLQANEVEQEVSIYGWLPSFDGSMKYTIPGDTSDEDNKVETGLADTIDSVFMANYQIRNDKFVFLADMIYLKMSASQEATITTPRIPFIPDITVGSEQELTAWLFGFYGGYNLIDQDNFRLDAMGGVRYLSLEAELSFSLNGLGEKYYLLTFIFKYSTIYQLHQRIEYERAC